MLFQSVIQTKLTVLLKKHTTNTTHSWKRQRSLVTFCSPVAQLLILERNSPSEAFHRVSQCHLYYPHTDTFHKKYKQLKLSRKDGTSLEFGTRAKIASRKERRTSAEMLGSEMNACVCFCVRLRRWVSRARLQRPSAVRAMRRASECASQTVRRPASPPTTSIALN